METPKLTQFSHGSGCGCKIAPADLEAILKGLQPHQRFANLIVDGSTRDDAAVMDIGNEQCIISTTDFFMPIVDDPFDFGRIAAANALSDVYAMGGKPLMAVAILGWPVEQLGPALASRVVDGAQHVCAEAGIPLAGGHSIDSKEPFFGLAVTGMVDKTNIKRNSGAQPGDHLYLTKAIGAGMASTAMKRGLLSESDIALLTEHMAKLNSIGEQFGALQGIHAMTDVTGFGLLGHLVEMCEGSGVRATIEFERIPKLPAQMLEPLLKQFVMPDNTMRNFKAYKDKCTPLSATQLQLLCDPQTNGGLLISVSPDATAEVEALCNKKGMQGAWIGTVNAGNEGVQISVV